jgi:monoamine oxidase
MAAAGLALPALPNLSELPFRIGGLWSDEDAVAIVGGGLAGLTAAYRLLQAGIACSVYEASPRFGGRVQTLPAFNREGMYCELGAELIDSDHTDLIGLATELGLEVEPLIEDGVSLPHELFYAGGKLHSEAEILAAFPPLAARLQKDIDAISPGGVLTIPTYNEPLGAEAIDRTSLAEYLDGMRGEVDPWLLRLVEVAYIGEYGREAAEQSSLNMLTMIDPGVDQGFRLLGTSDESLRIRGGNAGLVAALSEKLNRRVPLHPGYRLQAVKDSGTRLKLVFSTLSGTSEVRAARVLLALPFTMLREVEGVDRLGLSPAKSQAITELGYGTNAKLMLGFGSRFWRQDSRNAPASYGTFYTDLASQEFWETSRRQTGRSGILTSFVGGRAGESVYPERVARALRDLNRIHPGASAFWDGNQAQMVWRNSPYVRGSYACPGPGQYTAFIGAASEPELGGRLAFAGEHTSVDFLGFMNGAVASANAAVTDWISAVHASPSRRSRI